MKIAVGLIAIFFLSGCNTPDSLRAKWAAEEAEKGRATSVDEASYKATIGYWSIACAGGKKNAYGEKSGKPSCFAQYFPPSSYGFWMGSNTIFEVDQAGARVGRIRKKDSLCQSVAKRVAVDANRIDGLPQREQIARILDANKFAREDHGLWPECGLHNNEVRLERSREAYEAMERLWSTYRTSI
ncbi:MAG: hypothetical protein J0J10_09420 [Bosea sp.]|uniref:hypothetical protein n=1 Tax=Bosea sp. (in: a-proteobacteria) TaxID=1871050 RepID=UPI001AC4DB0D|nr:hypothetical protein [Bosea sp. (in: a-proteobacteria)]MBN9468977.1 hypothetical protein [Bosea sp. (in: a-proteobacteria)]